MPDIFIALAIVQLYMVFPVFHPGQAYIVKFLLTLQPCEDLNMVLIYDMVFYMMWKYSP